MKECFEFRLGQRWIWIVRETSVSIIFKTHNIQSSQLVNCLQELHCMKFRNHREQKSPIWPYFQLNSPYNCSAKRSVVDSNQCTWSNCKHAILLWGCWNPIHILYRTPLHPVWKLTSLNFLPEIPNKRILHSRKRTTKRLNTFLRTLNG